MWVFGYGSLMWDGWEKTRNCISLEVATLHGYKRSFNKESTKNWGTQAAPGPALGLEPSTGARCSGVAFEFPDTVREEIEDYLRKREGPSFTLIELPISLSGDHSISALAAVNDRESKTYIGNRSIEERATMARSAIGKSGSCVDYVLGIQEKLNELGITDTEVEEFVKEVSKAT